MQMAGRVKGQRARTDASAVVEFSTEAWVLVVGVMLSGILAMLHSFSTVIRNQCHIHDLKVRVNSLRVEYRAMEQARRESAEAGEIELDTVEIVTEPANSAHGKGGHARGKHAA
jgi:hypothetical protein